MEMGKSTVANVLMKEHGFKHVSFAQPLKDMVITLLQYVGYSYDDAVTLVTTQEGKSTSLGFPLNTTPRRLLQTLGTEWGRDTVHEDFWINLARKRVLNFLNNGESVVIDDMRFPNEYHAVATGFETSSGHVAGERVCIIRPSKEDNTASAHASEGALNDFGFDVVIQNNKSLEDLREAARDLPNYLKVRK